MEGRFWSVSFSWKLFPLSIVRLDEDPQEDTQIRFRNGVHNWNV
jgi:hypothetical protein